MGGDEVKLGGGGDENFRVLKGVQIFFYNLGRGLKFSPVRIRIRIIRIRIISSPYKPGYIQEARVNNYPMRNIATLSP